MNVSIFTINTSARKLNHNISVLRLMSAETFCIFTYNSIIGLRFCISYKIIKWFSELGDYKILGDFAVRSCCLAMLAEDILRVFFNHLLYHDGEAWLAVQVSTSRDLDQVRKQECLICLITFRATAGISHNGCCAYIYLVVLSRLV